MSDLTLCLMEAVKVQKSIYNVAYNCYKCSPREFYVIAHLTHQEKNI